MGVVTLSRVNLLRPARVSPCDSLVMVGAGRWRTRRAVARVGDDSPHSGSVSFERRLTQFFMLMTWLFSVRRSIRAAVR